MRHAPSRLLWCFECRKRLRHRLMILREPGYSYYEPQTWWQCDGCGHDRTQFPGTW